MSKHKKRNAFYWIIWEVNTVNEIWLAYVILQKEKFYEKLYKNCDMKTSSRPFCAQPLLENKIFEATSLY